MQEAGPAAAVPDSVYLCLSLSSFRWVRGVAARSPPTDLGANNLPSAQPRPPRSSPSFFSAFGLESLYPLVQCCFVVLSQKPAHAQVSLTVNSQPPCSERRVSNAPRQHLGCRTVRGDPTFRTGGRVRLLLPSSSWLQQ